MSSFVYMKILESAPERYDRGLRLMTGGRIAEVYELLARAAGAGPGRRMLDIGCGTGGVALACAALGAEVVGIDVNAGMLEVARKKPVPIAGGGRVEWLELGAAEIEDRFGEQSFSAVLSCLAMSELSADEQAYVLEAALSRLAPGGRLVLADEMLAETRVARSWRRLKRFPLAALTFALTQTTTRPVHQLARRVCDAGFTQIEEQRIGFADLTLLSARRPERAA